MELRDDEFKITVRAYNIIRKDINIGLDAKKFSEKYGFTYNNISVKGVSGVKGIKGKLKEVYLQS
jgi:hypothetical protein